MLGCEARLGVRFGMRGCFQTAEVNQPVSRLVQRSFGPNYLELHPPFK